LTRSNVSIDGNAEMPKASARAVLTVGLRWRAARSLIDFVQERERLLKEKEKLQKEEPGWMLNLATRTCRTRAG